MYGQKCGRKLVKPRRIEKKQEWAKEKPKLDNARKLGGIHFVDPDDKEYSARRKLERPIAPAMPYRRKDKQHPSITKVVQNNGKAKEFKTMESHQSTRHRAESLLFKMHEDRIAGKGFTSMTHCNLVHKFIPMPQATKIPEAKAAVDKDWKKLETIPAMDLEKSQEQ